MTSNHILIYAGFFIVTLLISFLLNGLLLRFAQSLGIRNASEVMRWSTQQKPALGGIPFFLVFLLSISCYAVFFPYRVTPMDTRLLGIIAAVSLAFIMGLADDSYNTRPILKFGVQVLCGVILIMTDLYIKFFSIPELNYAFTILWVVGMMNSFNMLDNMDAITATVSIFVLMTSLMIIVIHQDYFNQDVLVILGITGALVGFLFYNWHPSKMYMGDTGSQFLGILLAIFGIKYMWNSSDMSGQFIASKQFISVALAFILPLSDTTTVVINRLLKRKSPFIGGRDHTTHYLSYLGLSDSQVALAFCGISVVSMLLVLVIQTGIQNWGWKHIIIFALYILMVFGTLYAVTRLTRPPKKDEKSDN
jgi:UDP-GlcNAc:undecaprenyl-phosphate GlcNAc-1-phosphate transferase